MVKLPENQIEPTDPGLDEGSRPIKVEIQASDGTTTVIEGTLTEMLTRINEHQTQNNIKLYFQDDKPGDKSNIFLTERKPVNGKIVSEMNKEELAIRLLGYLQQKGADVRERVEPASSKPTTIQ